MGQVLSSHSTEEAIALPLAAVHIDHLLGNAGSRYFGSGYRRVTHHFSALTVVPPASDNGAGRVVADVGVGYPHTWSVKTDDAELRPHLSTVDALVIAVQLCGCYLAHAFGLDESAMASVWLRGFTMQSGTRPTENLQSIAAEARLVKTEPTALALLPMVSTFTCRVGTVKVSCTLEHPPGKRADGAGAYSTEADLLGNRDKRCYGSGYAARRHEIRGVRIDRCAESANATVRLSDEATDLSDGIEGRYQPTVLMVDAVVIIAQLSQALLYDMDGICRDSSNTLWMRRVTMSARSPYRPFAVPLLATVSTKSTKLLDHGGRRWRMTDMTAYLQGIDVTHSLAHALPAQP